MLLWQKLYYAGKKEIAHVAESIKSNKLFIEIKQDDIPIGYVKLFNNIQKSKYLNIRLLNLKTQLRHKVAVLVKSIARR